MQYPTTTAWLFLSVIASAVGRKAFSNSTTPTVMRLTKSPTGVCIRSPIGSSIYPQDPNHLRGSYGPAEYDVRHSFNANYVWELPVKAALGGHGPDVLVNGWQISGTIFARTGFPYTVIDNGESVALNTEKFLWDDLCRASRAPRIGRTVRGRRSLPARSPSMSTAPALGGRCDTQPSCAVRPIRLRDRIQYRNLGSIGLLQ